MSEYEEFHRHDFKVEDQFCDYNPDRDFQSLYAWKHSREVKVFFYKMILPNLPDEEKYNLNIQIRKASVSTTANIAEGYGRYHFQEGIQFYRIARGSLYELKDHLMSCYDFGYISKELFEKGLNLIETAKKTLNGFINFVKGKLK
ncbi:MAG: four helix bundle protein [bacterium]